MYLKMNEKEKQYRIHKIWRIVLISFFPNKFAEKFDSSLPEVEKFMSSGCFSIPDIIFHFPVIEVKTISNSKATG